MRNLIGGCILALSLTAHAEDLLKIYQDALGYDATYAGAKATYQAGIERLPQAKAGLRPSANISAEAGVLTVKRESVSAETGGSAGYTLSLAQPLYRKQNRIAVTQAERQIEQFKSQLSQAELDLALRVSQAYFDILLAQDNLAVSRSQKTAISEQLAQAKRNFEVGTATITDTHEAQARYDLAVSNEIRDQNELEVRLRALEQLIGRRPGELNTLKESIELPLPNPNNMDDWVSAALKTNPQVLAAQHGYEVSMQEIERNRAAYRPTLDLVGRLRGEVFSDDDLSFGGNSQSAQVGVQLSYDLWEGGLRASRVREATANAERSRQDLENARRTVSFNARQSFLAVSNGVAQVKALGQALVSTTSALDSTRLGQEVGVRTSIDVLNAQQQLFQARRDLLAARYNTILSQLRLKSAAGTLGASDISEVNNSLQAPSAAATATPQAARAVRGVGPTQTLSPADVKDEDLSYQTFTLERDKPKVKKSTKKRKRAR